MADLNDEIQEKLNRLTKLEAFYNRIRYLTSNHDVINDHACVTARVLGEELSKIDPDWYKADYKVSLTITGPNGKAVEVLTGLHMLLDQATLTNFLNNNPDEIDSLIQYYREESGECS